MMTDTYQDQAAELERRWQLYWKTYDIDHTPNPGELDFDPSREKFFLLDFFPYPSGIGLHIGHPLGYIATDIVARFERMRGKNVLYSMGFDAFGLPAEQYAVQTGQHPRVTTEHNISNMLSQLELLGLSHDRQRRFNTTDPGYYRWTQWIFLILFESFYDPNERWTGPDGHENVGRALPVGVLEQRLRKGEWTVDDDGTARPAEGSSTKLSDEAITRAIDRARLAYVDEVPVNWCPRLGTVLANEEVTNEGKSERGNYPVYRRPLRQWILRITSYAERLLADLAALDWPAGIVEQQRAWIGRSAGAQIAFSVAGSDVTIDIFTTRPDTIFGATFLVLAPEHPLVAELTSPEKAGAVRQYVGEASSRRSQSRGATPDLKTGVALGARAAHPLTGELIPIWVADYVMIEYGTGAIMAVPGHDERDFAFAREHGLPIRTVVRPPSRWMQEHAEEPLEEAYQRYLADAGAFGEPYTGDGEAVQSSSPVLSIDGLATSEAIARVVDWVADNDCGKKLVRYKLRDWLFSRQRYWGEPFPVVFDDESGRYYALDETELPVLLPEIADFSPVTTDDPDSLPQPPLARAEDWLHVEGVVLPNGRVRLGSVPLKHEGAVLRIRKFRRDPNTMPNWAGSCWYYLRYCDPHNNEAFVSGDAEKYWMRGRTDNGEIKPGGVDLYVGGAEHAVLHLLYARFWHKVLYDRGFVSTREPFNKLFNQGMITADAYSDSRGVYVDIHDVEMVLGEDGRQQPRNRTTGEILRTEAGKMGKRYKNGIPPEEVASEYSVDTFRLFEMYLGPLDATKPWNSTAIVGMHRFLASVWQLLRRTPGAEDTLPPAPEELDSLVHRTISRVTSDIEKLRMNTAITALIELTRALTRHPVLYREHAQTIVLLLAPFAPHVAEELLSRHFPEEHARLKSVMFARWPGFDPSKIAERSIEVPITVNGKKRAAITVPFNTTDEEIKKLAMQHEAIVRAVGGNEPGRVILARQGDRVLLNLVI